MVKDAAPCLRVQGSLCVPAFLDERKRPRFLGANFDAAPPYRMVIVVAGDVELV